MKVLVLIPAFNEEENIENVISELKIDFPQADVLVVDDFSKDKTLSILKTLPDIKYLSLSCNLGYAGALQVGFKYAVKNEYDYVVQFDGDGQHIAKEANRLYGTIIDENVDIVIGSRFKAISNYKHSFFRKLGTQIFRKTIYAICKTDITDPTSGFQVLTRKVFEKYALLDNYPEYPDANLIIEMLLCGYKIIEVPVEMRLRVFGESMHGGVIKPIKYMIKMGYAILLIFFNKKGYLKKNTIRWYYG